MTISKTALIAFALGFMLGWLVDLGAVVVVLALIVVFIVFASD